MFKTVFIDLDNTLYNYTLCHEKAIMTIKNNLSSSQFDANYDKYKKIINSRNVCIKHNKRLYIKSICDEMKCNSQKAYELCKLYDETFNANIVPYEGITELFDFFNKNNINIYVLTNSQYDVQMERLNRLKLLDRIQSVITSEELGIEKPDPMFFNYACKIANAKPNEIIMIGDDINNDIEGAINYGIFSAYFNVNSKNDLVVDRYIEFNNYNRLVTFFTGLFKSIDELVYLSQFYGGRIDYVQGAGGNISVKYDNLLIIKSSGVNLIEMTKSNGYSIVKNDINDQKLIKTVIRTDKPSMEIWFHSFLKKYVLHMHPMWSNVACCRVDCEDMLKYLFGNPIIVPYMMPGIKLAQMIKSILDNKSDDQNGDIIFLENHGIIITADDIETLDEMVCKTMIKFYDLITRDDSDVSDMYKSYRMAGIIRKLLLKHNENILTKPMIGYSGKMIYDTFVPDKEVYCREILQISELAQIEKLIDTYITYHNYVPKVIIYNNGIYINETNVNKLHDLEDIIIAHLMIADEQNSKALTEDELKEIKNNEDEKYRMK